MDMMENMTSGANEHGYRKLLNNNSFKINTKSPCEPGVKIGAIIKKKTALTYYYIL